MEDSQFDEYFSDGLKPPTRLLSLWVLPSLCIIIIITIVIILAVLSPLL